MPILPSQIIPRDVECIRNMLHRFSRPGIILYQDDIESARTIINPVLRQILRRKLNQFGTFARIHRFNRTTVGPSPSPFHLDEHQHPLIIGNQIEFAQWGTHIPAKDSKPLSAQIGLGSPLSFIPYQSASVAHRSSGPSDLVDRGTHFSSIADTEVLHRRKTPAMNRTGPVLPEQTEMLRSPVTFMLGKIILGIPTVVFNHQTIARHLGDDRGGRNGGGEAIALDDRALRN